MKSSAIEEGTLKRHSPVGNYGGCGPRPPAQHFVFPKQGAAEDCTVETVGSLQGDPRLSASCRLTQLTPRQAGLGAPRAYLDLLLRLQLLPSGLPVCSEAQELRGALSEELLVVDLQRLLQPRLLAPPLQHEAQPCCPHLRGQSARLTLKSPAGVPPPQIHPMDHSPPSPLPGVGRYLCLQ